MSVDGRDPLEILRKLAESYRGITFGPGVVGKTSYATLGLLAIWAVILWRLSETSVALNFGLIAGGLIATGVYCWWVRKTQELATRNPGLAMLEGAQFIEYQKWEAEVKGLPPLKGPRIPNPEYRLPDEGRE